MESVISVLSTYCEQGSIVELSFGGKEIVLTKKFENQQQSIFHVIVWMGFYVSAF